MGVLAPVSPQMARGAMAPPALIQKRRELTPTQPSPIEGEGSVRPYRRPSATKRTAMPPPGARRRSMASRLVTSRVSMAMA
jgi:hypothetical protein